MKFSVSGENSKGKSMAKFSVRGRRGGDDALERGEYTVPEISLSSILEEYRNMPQEMPAFSWEDTDGTEPLRLDDSDGETETGETAELDADAVLDELRAEYAGEKEFSEDFAEAYIEDEPQELMEGFGEAYIEDEPERPMEGFGEAYIEDEQQLPLESFGEEYIEDEPQRSMESFAEEYIEDEPQQSPVDFAEEFIEGDPEELGDALIAEYSAEEEALPEENAEEYTGDDTGEYAEEDGETAGEEAEEYADAVPEELFVSGEQIEGFEDDADVYAAALTEETPSDEAEPSETDEPAEKRSRKDRKNKKTKTEKGKAGAKKTVSLGQTAALGVWQRLRALADNCGERSWNSTYEPQPEDVELEMSARQAAKHYAAQMPALRLRMGAAMALCALLAWITFSCGFSLPMPGHLETNTVSASLVCAVGLLTVMLLGLDVLTVGLRSLLQGQPGAESLLLLASLASFADVIAMIVSGKAERGLALCAVPAVSIAFALLGAWYSSRAYQHSFLSFSRAETPYVVTSEEIEGRTDRYMIRSEREVSGFILRAEERHIGEVTASAAFLPLTAVSLAIALAAALGSGDAGSFFHTFSVMLALSSSANWLLAFPMLFAKTARHLLRAGSALAGWLGARDLGMSRRLILTDTDIFPEGAIEITGIRYLDKNRADEILECTGSLLAAAGAGTASVFTELMRRSGAALRKVEDFTVGEGGVTAAIDEREVRIGSAGYMHLNGVKIPDRVKAENAVYTAFGTELMGVFHFRYQGVTSVHHALVALRRGHRKPVLAMRDFNVDPLLLQRAFDVSTEGFEFPAMTERYRISGVAASGKTPAAAVLTQSGLDALVDAEECGTRLYTYGRISAVLSVISAFAGMLIMLVPCWLGSWEFAGAATVLLYTLVWLIPTIIMNVLLQK